MNINLIKGDTGIGRRVTLITENGAVDLTDATVLFMFGDHTLYPIKLEEPGKLLLVFEREHTAQSEVYKAQFKVIYSDDRKETFPGADDEKINVHISEY